ncbi:MULTISPECIES: hypothetical protein [Bacillaceae]|uniref:hypothetical protein n=1 Tax=Bacillaceae TaxID=186817 RepID=UPI0008F906CF|nr:MULTISPECIES: hypothetical protein [Bacillaceae]GLB61781.1 hypothetical protein NCCP133_39100 [Cytobacillus sp. NCCP-133]
MTNLILTKIKNDIEESVDRYKSILAIPRKNDTLVEDIEAILLIVKEHEEINHEQLTTIIMETFGVSFNTAFNVRPILERANLLRQSNKIVKLTNMSENYLQTKDISYLSKGFIYSYFGFLELLYLIHKNAPKYNKDLFNEWVALYEERYGKRAKHTNRVQMSRINVYLVGFNLINKSEGKLVVNSEAFSKLDKIGDW